MNLAFRTNKIRTVDLSIKVRINPNQDTQYLYLGIVYGFNSHHNIRQIRDIRKALRDDAEGWYGHPATEKELSLFK